MAYQGIQETERNLFTLEQIWEEILSLLKQKLSPPGYDFFSSSVAPGTFSDGVLTLFVSNAFTKEWIKERCENIIINHFQNAYKQSLPILYSVVKTEEETVNNAEISHSQYWEGNKEDPPQKKDIIHIPIQKAVQCDLNPKYTFDTFVIGDSNRFTYAACSAVAEAPAKAYNPLFIYGGSGLGKTHLLNAMAREILSNNPSWKVVYVPSEEFTNDLINSLRDRRIPEFRDRYRNGVDVLLMDDIQFIGGKERTEEEFFHTFNAIHAGGKQVIVSSDRPPKELKTLSDRLRSRFEWGLIADIQPPDFETRIAILRKKADDDNIDIPDEVIDFIATQIPSNVRELEGALTRIIAYGSLVHKPLTVNFAENLIKDMVSPHRDKPATISLIKRAVSEYFQISIEDISSRKRTKEIAEARQIAMYLSRKMTKSSLPKIGEEFGGRDHTTVMHACDKIKEWINQESSFKLTIDEIVQKLSKD